MAEFKLTIADPIAKKTYKYEVKEAQADALMGLKLGSSVDGDSIGLANYTFTITGGSDFCGFPMREGINVVRKHIVMRGGVGLATKGGKGHRKRKTVCGNTINDTTKQINLKLSKGENIGSILGEKPKEAA